MIGYPISQAELERCIEVEKPGWLHDAREACEAAVRARHLTSGPSWRDIKPVFLTLQHHKCGYCERKLEVRGELDTEHFRPKARVDALPAGRGVPTRDRRRHTKLGYYWLTFWPRNYLLSCKCCNQSRKKNYFPTFERRVPPSCNPTQLEDAYLVHPLDPTDTAPEMLLDFVGIAPMPRQGSSARGRARIGLHIELFDLGHREMLLQERGRSLIALFAALESGVERAVELACAPTQPHTACLRSFKILYERDPAMARRIRDGALLQRSETP